MVDQWIYISRLVMSLDGTFLSADRVAQLCIPQHLIPSMCLIGGRGVYSAYWPFIPNSNLSVQ